MSCRDAEQIEPLASIAVGFVYADETGSGDVYRIEKTDQVGGFAARLVEATGDDLADAWARHQAAQRGEFAPQPPTTQT